MKLASVLALSASATAHTVFTTLYVDGTSQGDGTAVRMRRDPSKASAPMHPDVPAIACGYDGELANPRVASVDDGATLTFEFRSWANDPSKGAIDPRHVGPCSIYLKKVDSAVANNTAAGDGWFKIWEEGYDEDEKTWCTSKLGGNGVAGPYNGTLSVALPVSLAGGYYLARPELLALHAAPDGDPQFYTGCAQIFVDSAGDKVPRTTVSIPGHVAMSDPSVTFNIYKTPLALPYSMPGPAVAELVSSGGANGATCGGSASAAPTQTEGLEPEGCILTNAGFCATESPDYSDEKGCWDVSCCP